MTDINEVMEAINARLSISNWDDAPVSRKEIETIKKHIEEQEAQNESRRVSLSDMINMNVKLEKIRDNYRNGLKSALDATVIKFSFSESSEKQELLNQIDFIKAKLRNLK